MNYFAGKVAIVTGGASGIGLALCLEIAGRGAKAVIIADINGERAREAAAALSDQRATKPILNKLM